MAHKQTRPWSHAEFRHRSQIPMPAVEEAEQRLLDVLTPSVRALRQLERGDPRQPQRLLRMRQRLLTLPVIVAIITGTAWRALRSCSAQMSAATRAARYSMARVTIWCRFWRNMPSPWGS